MAPAGPEERAGCEGSASVSKIYAPFPTEVECKMASLALALQGRSEGAVVTITGLVPGMEMSNGDTQSAPRASFGYGACRSGCAVSIWSDRLFTKALAEHI
jgi:hypothetical protein